MTELLHWDEYFFHLINLGCQNAFFDELLPILRNKYTWFPFYLFLLTFFLINYRRQGLVLVLALSLTIGLSDSISSHLIKKSVKRARPCKIMDRPDEINLLVRCGSGYSFPSTHASNHFAIAVFLSLSLGKIFRWVPVPLLFWALIISFSQIYVGLHYPLDATVGALLGFLIGWLVYKLTGRYFNLEQKNANAEVTPVAGGNQ